MNITAVKAIPLKCACSPISDALGTSTGRQALLVKIETDCGLYGLGEAFTYGAPLPLMKYMVEDYLGAMIIGRDPLEIEEIWNMLYWRTIAHGRRSLAMGGISGIDIALWDLYGKTEHKSVSELLGKKLDRIPSYASGGFYAPGKGLDGLREELEGYRKQGYRNAKIKIGRNSDRPGSPLRYMANRDYAVTVEEDLRRIETAQEVLGDGLLSVDTNASWNVEEGIEGAKELKKRGIYWLEEPIPFEETEGLQAISEIIPVAGFETQQGLKNFRNHIKANAVDIVQPDLGWAGGITECRKIGALAEETGRKISLHCFGSAILFAASLQLAAAMPNTEMIESEENPNPLKSEIGSHPLETDAEMNFFVPQGEGIGMDLNWDVVEKYQVTV
ncbi:MAG: mandelate racemase/muconate lactonizing enzyme family protein [Lachnospiraceae bacterium]|nr:mandelate racemase/muconate lactonizing enzyme family protein [Lachnospiraceae bacterium]